MPAIALDRHAVVEASAGTGKTFTLEQRVLELLIDRQVRLEQILLVTYTEKATGELKDRLRATLEKQREERPDQRPVLQAALDAFDQAAISTIHGFCQRVLQEYAFENGQEFRFQLVHDQDLLEACLREVQRRNWREEFGSRLPLILALAGYDRPGGGAEWERRVQQIVGSFRPICGHRLHPEPRPNWLDSLQCFEDHLRAAWSELRQRIPGPPLPDRIEDHPWYVGFGRLNYRDDWRETRRSQVLLPLLRWLADPEAEATPIATFQRLLAECAASGTFERDGFYSLTVKLTAKAQEELPRRCPSLNEAVPIVEQLRRESAELALGQQLMVRTVQQLQELLATLKRERGLQSFDDLLARVDQALDTNVNERAPALLEALRERYRYAIVDEFQDTDPLQWRIFKRIFVEGGGAHRLIVVGDPKQAIFGFRGADLNAFLTARDELQRLHHAEVHSLNVNWRSAPELLEALNRLFEQGQWFDGTGITYTRVAAPPEAQQPNRITVDHTGRAALTLVNVSHPERLVVARRENARFIAGEIQRLLARPALEFTVKKKSSTLRADHICILVSKRSEAGSIIDELRQAGIPFTFYKQPGLWQSDEAVHLEYLLRALATPHEAEAFRKALLTRFFGIRPEILANCDELPIHHAVHERFLHWRQCAQERHWAELFQSVLEDTGVLLTDLASLDADRRRANYRLIIQTLLQSAYIHDLDLLGLLETFAELRRRPGDEETDLQPIETEKPKVRILTVHAAKGLEFPVVFLAGGFTQGRTPDWWTYHDGPQQQIVFDLEGSATAKEAHRKEREAEDRRLLYVALTRAMFKLYVPMLAVDRSYRSPGPTVTILAQAIARADLPALGPSRVEVARPAHAGTTLVPAVVPPPEEAVDVLSLFPPVAIEAPAELFPQLDPNLRQRRIMVRSFSSLHRESQQAARETPIYVGYQPRADDDAPDVLEDQALLRGPIFGAMVHAVLEEIDFAAVHQAPEAETLLAIGTSSRALIDDQLLEHLAELPTRSDGEDIADSCRHQIAQLVWAGLRTPLTVLGGPLGTVPAADRVHELAFDFPDLSPQPSPLGGEGQGEGIRRQEGFLTGIIDLVVRRAGKFFLIDWKTNDLGAYTPDDLQRSMAECDYHRQYRLYLQALARWLKRVHGRLFNLRRDFGGVYYLYLRGLNGADETSGVCFIQPTAADLRLDRVLGD